MATGAPYIADEIERAIRLHDGGLSWRIVGQRLGRPPGALSVTVSFYRRGLWAPAQKFARKDAVETRIEALVSDGMISAADIGRQLGVSRFTATQRLARMGLDVEMRRELAGAGAAP